MGRPEPEKIDIAERGAGGARSDRRLFMQLLAFTGVTDTSPLTEALAASGLEAALYDDVNDPCGVALVTATEDPAVFTGPLRRALGQDPFARLTPRPELTMLGRTYTLGYEPDLDEALLNRPRRHLLEPDWPWAVWYPLRRKGSFHQLDPARQRDILKEHGTIGYAFGAADLAHDIRLACHGLDPHDNDFVIGLMGKDLTPLSKIVERMRKTEQTSTYIENLGPFFVGKKTWNSPPPPEAAPARSAPAGRPRS